MANGALQPEDQELLNRVDQAQAAQPDPAIGALSGMDRMVDPLRDEIMTGGPTDAEIDEKIAAYKRDTKDIDLDGKKDNVWKRFKGWWKKGLEDDPTTVSVDESDPDTQVTRFMGGMTRQELSMFLFEWGGLMMTNADQGLGGAFGAASLGAMEGHRTRTQEDAALAMQEEDQALREREVSARERTAAFAGQAQGFTDPDGYWVVPRYDPETNEVTWERATNKEGALVKGDPALSRDYQGEKVFLEQFFTEAGWTKEQIADYFGKAKGPAARRQDLMDALMKRISDAGILDVDPITGKKFKEFSESDIKMWVERMAMLEGEMGNTKSADDYITE